uniref:Uncharacterized protein n=1 Tax=Arundo donax TaxID=35708 RepID=A0A0A9D8B2_ARUDO
MEQCALIKTCPFKLGGNLETSKKSEILLLKFVNTTECCEKQQVFFPQWCSR